MFLRTKLLVAGLAANLIAFGGLAAAQQSQPSAPSPAPGVQQTPRAGMARRARQRRPRQPMRVLRQLNLTDAQKQQVRASIQTNLESTKAQRQELRQLTRQWRQGTLTPEGLARVKELRGQVAQGRKAQRDQLIAILTPEQKAKLEEGIKARRAGRGFGRQGLPPN